VRQASAAVMRRSPGAQTQQHAGEPPAPAPAPAPAPPAPARILELQRSAGNAAVARLIQRDVKTPLPPIAGGLKDFRAGLPRLRALAAAKPPALPAGGDVDIQPALDWLREVVATFQLVESIVDPSALVFESVVVPGHDEEYGAAEAAIRPQVQATLQAVVPVARDTATAIRREVLASVNASTVVKADRAADPHLPSLDQATAWREQSAALAHLAGTVDPRGIGLRDAALVCEDAALALLQARSVIEARTTWRSGAAESADKADIPKSTRRRDEVDDVFADSGFGSTQSLRDNGTPEDWCGMFAAANMFRAAALPKNVRLAFAHANNVHDFFTYNPSPTRVERTPVSIWAEGRWWGVQEYHLQRGLARTWIASAGAAGADIRPGDIVLIRHTGAKPADAIANHIVMVESFDAAAGKLVTIEGNVLEGIHPDAATGEAKRTAGGDLASTSTAHTSTVVEIRDINDTSTATPAGAGPGGVYQERGRKTIFGVGRPSLVDFEAHDYGTIPVPMEFQYVSPEEMRKRGKGAQLAPASTVQSPADSPYHRRQ
jgi:hypothetical protein